MAVCHFLIFTMDFMEYHIYVSHFWQQNGNKKSDSPNHLNNESNINNPSQIP